MSTDPLVTLAHAAGVRVSIDATPSGHGTIALATRDDSPFVVSGMPRHFYLWGPDEDHQSEHDARMNAIRDLAAQLKVEAV